MFKIRTCPVCGSEPQLVHWERDRDLFPSLDNLRYSCGIRGHIIAAPWSEANLGQDKNSPTLIALAVEAWNDMIEKITNAGRNDR